MGIQLFSGKQNYIRICVNTATPDIQGTAFSLLTDAPIDFLGLADFILKLDAVFDKAGYPQAFEEKRSFSKKTEEVSSYQGIPKIKNDVSDFERQFGKKYTLELYVESRRKTNWQGRLYAVMKDGLERELLGTFESEMELLKMIEKIE